MYKKYSNEINLQEKLSNIGQLGQTFQIINKLNQILEQVLPTHLYKNCHMGAIDIAEDTAVLYVTEQSLFHIIRTFSNSILREFDNNNFHFDKLLIRNRVVNKRSAQPNLSLDSTAIHKLSQIAAEIGKPEIIKAPAENQTSEDEIVF